MSTPESAQPKNKISTEGTVALSTLDRMDHMYWQHTDEALRKIVSAYRLDDAQDIAWVRRRNAANIFLGLALGEHDFEVSWRISLVTINPIKKRSGTPASVTVAELGFTHEYLGTDTAKAAFWQHFPDDQSATETSLPDDIQELPYQPFQALVPRIDAIQGVGRLLPDLVVCRGTRSMETQLGRIGVGDSLIADITEMQPVSVLPGA